MKQLFCALICFSLNCCAPSKKELQPVLYYTVDTSAAGLDQPSAIPSIIPHTGYVTTRHGRRVFLTRQLEKEKAFVVGYNMANY